MSKKFIKVMGITLQTSVSLNANTNQDVIKYSVPPNLIARPVKRHLYVSNNGALGQITWSLKKNQIQVFPYGAMKDITPLPIDISDDNIDFESTSELEVNINNADGANQWSAGIMLQLDLGYYI